MKGFSNVHLCSFSLRHQLRFEDQSYSLSLIGNICLSVTARLFQKALLLDRRQELTWSVFLYLSVSKSYQLSTLCLPAGMLWSRHLLSPTFLCILTTVVRNRAALQSQLPNGLQVTRSTVPRTYMNILFQTHNSAPYHSPFLSLLCHQTCLPLKHCFFFF